MAATDEIASLLEQYPHTFAEQAGITLADKPSPLFRLLVLTSLLSANIDAELGLRTARALNEAGYTTAQRLADASDDDRWQVLSQSKYLRKKQTARQLGDLAEHAVDAYGGDLRKLGDASDGAEGMRTALQDFAGIGPTGADIFLREVQTAWSDLRPFADERVLGFARDAGLPHTLAGLARAAGTDDLAHVGAALVLADRDRRAG